MNPQELRVDTSDPTLLGEILANVIPERRDPRRRMRMERQLAMYAPCRCGSGRKFKFCCWKKAPAERSK